MSHQCRNFLPTVECTGEIAEDYHHDFNHAVEEVDETVKDGDSYHAIPSPPPHSKFGVDYFVDSEPISGHSRTWEAIPTCGRKLVIGN